jgi:CDP-diacylglycerol--serine O-phosphatidyltransferase
MRWFRHARMDLLGKVTSKAPQARPIVFLELADQPIAACRRFERCAAQDPIGQFHSLAPVKQRNVDVGTTTGMEMGREMDSLADVITFGIAPGVLAFSWGVFFVNQTVGPPVDPRVFQYLRQAGYFCAFLFLICGALRLARFNIQKNPMPKNPGRSDRKYFVGLPIPAGAALVASIVYASDGTPLADWRWAAGWLALLALLAFLMVSTWRYPSFKDVHLTRPRSPVTIVLYAAAIYLIWNFPQPAVFGMSVAYVLSGIVIRIGGLVRRRMRPPPPRPEHQIG